MNPYFATGFLSALIFWVWPAFLYRTLDAHLVVIFAVSAALFVGLGRFASEIHVRYIAPRHPPKGSVWLIGAACAAIFAIGALTRFVYDAGART